MNMTKDELYLFNQGRLFKAYECLGAHVLKGRTSFAVWAPGVKSVAVSGDFNGWSDSSFYLSPLENSGIFFGSFPAELEDKKYKYVIETPDGQKLWKSDPYAVYSEKRPATASIVHTLSYQWNDKGWTQSRLKTDHFSKPKNIYELHAGSWKRHPLPEDADQSVKDNNFYSYRELADSLIPYVKDMGYNYIELLPVMEHPFDGSWGYQITGYYSATSRYGTPEELMYLIDSAHQNGIGVILDWVPGHFCLDAHGLAQFNGNMLYENSVHPNWGTGKFDFGRPEVRSFLISNALFWLNEFHADGLRVDGVSSMLYLNFGIEDKKDFKYNKYGEEGNLEAIEFLKELSGAVAEFAPGCFTVAEESSAWPLVTYPPDDGGLGFHYKWNMGWMNDTLSYFSSDFPYRSANHSKLSFSMIYAFSENFILPFSHDEVVHGKRSLLDKQPGDHWRQFAGKRIMSLYQMTHPGAKLNFMGNEFAPFMEWRYYEELEWFLPEKYEPHTQHMQFTKDLNRLYLNEPALWEVDKSWDGFQWIDADNKEQNIISYMRTSADGNTHIIVILNTGLENYSEYRIGVPAKGQYMEIFSSDRKEYGGNGFTNPNSISAEEIPYQGQPWSIKINLSSLGGCMFKISK